MRALWERFRSELLVCSRSEDARTWFLRLRTRHSDLRRFGDASDLVAGLASPSIASDRKERIYRILVVESRGARYGFVARAIVWLGLWPGLDHLFHRLSVRFVLRSRPGGDSTDTATRTLVSHFVHHVNRQVAEIELDGVSHIPATLIRNVERDIYREYQRQRRHDSTHETLQAEPSPGSRVPPQLCIFPLDEPGTGPESFFAVPGHLPLDEQLALLPIRMRTVVGEADADLLLDVLVLGKTQQQFATERKLKPATVRQRFGRALQRLRTHIERSRQRPLSRSGPVDGVSLVTGPHGPK